MSPSKATHGLLRVVHRWVQTPAWLVPRPVQVRTSKVASIVAVDYAVWVEHGNNLEAKTVAQQSCIEAGSREEVKHTLHHPACIALARVHSAAQEYAALLSARQVAHHAVVWQRHILETASRLTFLVIAGTPWVASRCVERGDRE